MILDPDSFQGWQWMLLICVFLRGLIFFKITKLLLPAYPLYAVACGLIAIFHPADDLTFWMDSIGVDFALVIALLCCYCALSYIKNGNRISLLFLYLFQLISTFTYTAFLGIILVFPIGLWILSRIEKSTAPSLYLLKVEFPAFVSIIFQIYIISKHNNRDGILLDLNMRRVLGGFAHEIPLLLTTLIGFFRSLEFSYFYMALAPAILSYAISMRLLNPNKLDASTNNRMNIHYYWTLTIGLLVLALLSYLPYGIARIVRFGHDRQLLAAGMFVYAAVLLPIFIIAIPHQKNKRIGGFFLALLAIFVVVTGLEQRNPYLNNYRSEEGFLQELATVVPNPNPYSIIVVRLEANRAKQISGLYNRRWNFQQALRFMYKDRTLQGGFAEFVNPFDFDTDKLIVNQPQDWNKHLESSYAQLIVLESTYDGSLKLMSNEGLQKFAPREISVEAYNPKIILHEYSQNGIVCQMLERPFRPQYCK